MTKIRINLNKLIRIIIVTITILSFILPSASFAKTTDEATYLNETYTKGLNGVQLAHYIWQESNKEDGTWVQAKNSDGTLYYIPRATTGENGSASERKKFYDDPFYAADNVQKVEAKWGSTKDTEDEYQNEIENQTTKTNQEADDGLSLGMKGAQRAEYIYNQAQQENGMWVQYGDHYVPRKYITDYGVPTGDEITPYLTDDYKVENIKAEAGIKDEPESTEEDDEDPGFLNGAGGILMEPFLKFINAIADSIASALQSFMMGKGNWVMTDDVVDDAKVTDVDPKDADIIINSNYGGGILGVIGSNTWYPNFRYTCEEIFANKVPWLDVNFLNPTIKDLKGSKDTNIAYKLQDIIKAWYRVLRLIAIVGLLSILIYTGIKIMIESNTEKRAKYKERIVDWLVAFVILFAMNYIMSFTLSISSELTDLFTGPSEETRNIIVYYSQGDADKGNQMFRTNLMGLARFKVQNPGLLSEISYEVIYIALLVFTIRFTIEYFKRVIMMAFLTLIAPIVALTYPIDKMGDGSAQGFQRWLRDYIFNALLQPMHYLIYTILIGSAITLAANNPIYPIVVLLFMSQAEKFVRDLFGFGKAGGLMEPGGRGAHAFASGAITTQLLNRIGKGNNNGGGKNSKNKIPTTKPPKTMPTGDIGELPETGESTIDALAGAGTINDVVNNNENKGSKYNNQIDDNLNQQTTPSGIILPQSTIQNMAQQQAIQEKANANKNSQPTGFTDAFKKNNTIRTKAGTGKGLAAVGKKIIKPVWNPDKSAKYNGKRIAKGVAKGLAKGYVAAGLGVAAATAELGVSLTDGKFSPTEAVASVATGIAAGNAITGGIGKLGTSIADTYNNAEYGSDYQLEKYQQQWNESDEVNSYYAENFGENKDVNMRIASDEFLTRGITDMDEQRQAFNYMDTLANEDYSQWEKEEQAQIREEHADFSEVEVRKEFERRQESYAEQIRKDLGISKKKLNDENAVKAAMRAQHASDAATTIKFKKQLATRGALYDSKKQAEYINKHSKERAKKLGISEAEARNQIANAIENVNKFDAANKI